MTRKQAPVRGSACLRFPIGRSRNEIVHPMGRGLFFRTRKGESTGRFQPDVGIVGKCARYRTA